MTTPDDFDITSINDTSHVSYGASCPRPSIPLSDTPGTRCILFGPNFIQIFSLPYHNTPFLYPSLYVSCVPADVSFPPTCNPFYLQDPSAPPLSRSGSAASWAYGRRRRTFLTTPEVSQRCPSQSLVTPSPSLKDDRPKFTPEQVRWVRNDRRRGGGAFGSARYTGPVDLILKEIWVAASFAVYYHCMRCGPLLPSLSSTASDA